MSNFGNPLKIGKELYYSEAHHIIPLGNPYNGKDVLNNMICVCPNHHTLLDFKSISLEISLLKLTRKFIEELLLE